MAKMVLLLLSITLSLSILPLLASATFHVKGSVYCDTCRAGFETNATFYIQGTNLMPHFTYLDFKKKLTSLLVLTAETLT